MFEPKPLSPESIAKLAPVLERGVARLGVFRSGFGSLEIWGVVADRSTYLEVRCVAPGRVVVQKPQLAVDGRLSGTLGDVTLVATARIGPSEPDRLRQEAEDEETLMVLMLA